MLNIYHVSLTASSYGILERTLIINLLRILILHVLVRVLFEQTLELIAKSDRDAVPAHCMLAHVLANDHIGILTQDIVSFAFANLAEFGIKEVTALLNWNILVTCTHPVHHSSVELAFVTVLVLADVSLDWQDVHVDRLQEFNMLLQLLVLIHYCN